MATAISEPLRRPWRASAAVLAVAVASVLVAVVLIRGMSSTSTATNRSGPFGWFTATATPAGWHALRLPDGSGTLSAPSWVVALPSDPGTVSAGLPAGSGRLIYLNATPREGDERLGGWPAFRIAHLRDEHATRTAVEAQATHLPFRGGTGSCVQDDYVTLIGANHYREIACFVQGAHHASVVVAAAAVSEWARYQATIRRTIDAYTVN